jgi:hypothetical protein
LSYHTTAGNVPRGSSTRLVLIAHLLTLSLTVGLPPDSERDVALLSSGIWILCLLSMALTTVTTSQAKHCIRAEILGAEILTSEALFQYVQPFPSDLLINVQGLVHRQHLVFGSNQKDQRGTLRVFNFVLYFFRFPGSLIWFPSIVPRSIGKRENCFFTAGVTTGGVINGQRND